MEYMPIREAAEKWGVSGRWVQMLCINGRIDGVERIGNMWVIPKISNLKESCSDNGSFK